MRSAKKQLGELGARPLQRSAFRTMLPYFNLMLVAGLSFGLVGVTRRVVGTEGEKHGLELELLRTRADFQRLQRTNDDRIAMLLETQRASTDGRVAEKRVHAELLDGMVQRLAVFEDEARADRQLAVTNFQEEVTALRESIRHELEEKTSTEERFRDFERIHGEGVVLIYTEFDYERIRENGRNQKKTVSGWGTGFFLTTEGHIITNKHVVQPWKFDSDLAAMDALGEIRVDTSSLRIACWPAGTRAFDERGEPMLDVGFNSWKRRNLHIAALAPDAMVDHDMELGTFGPHYRLHELNNDDLALLKADGADFHALPLAPIDRPLGKLEPVMALGFPRGQNGLERGVAESSPSIGTIRKAERTIHITASIIPGNSGGPLVSQDGEVLGIVTRIYSETLGICIRLEHALALLSQVRSKSEVKGEEPASLEAGVESAR